MPFLWVLLLLLLALFLQSQRWRRISLATAVALLLLLSNPFLANEAMRAWEGEARSLQELETYDAAVVLGGITSYRANMPDRVHTSKGADRFLHPLQLYRLGKVRKFIISGGSGQVLGTALPEAEQIEKILLMAGVAEADILTESQSRNTRENALYTARLLKRHPKWKNILLVTSAFHMRRAAGCFQKAGVQADSFNTDFCARERSYTLDEIIIPSLDAFAQWQLLIHEVTGYFIYKVLGYC